MMWPFSERAWRDEHHSDIADSLAPSEFKPTTKGMGKDHHVNSMGTWNVAWGRGESMLIGMRQESLTNAGGREALAASAVARECDDKQGSWKGFEQLFCLWRDALRDGKCGIAE
jgi:hypothetical protein